MPEKQERDGLEMYIGNPEADESVLYLGGWADFPVYHDAVPKLLEVFEEAGFATMAAPYRGVLGQSGEFTVDSMVDDAVEYAKILNDVTGNEVVVVGNCMGANAALGAAARTDVVEKMVTMNGLFGLRDDPWWNSEEEWAKRAARWPKIEEGEDGILGTEFRGLEEEFFKDVVCHGQDEMAHHERLEEFAHLPLLMMVSYRDEKIDPLHTWSLYRDIRNHQERADLDERAEIHVVCEEDERHTLLLTDVGLQRDVVSWIEKEADR